MNQNAAGDIVLQLDPSEENARNSEGAFLVDPPGPIRFMYTRYGSESRDDSAATIVAIESDDDGRTWSERPTLVVDREGQCNVMSVSLQLLPDGRALLVYLRKNGWQDCAPIARTSTDGGRTFGPPRPVLVPPGYYVVNNDRLIRTASGRLVLPVCHHRHAPRFDASAPGNRRYHGSQGYVFFALSDDDGETWFESDHGLYVCRPNGDGLQEPGVVELADGRLWTWARPAVNEGSGQWGAWSEDGGLSWSDPRQCGFPSPRSPMSVKRAPGGALVAVWNHPGLRAGLPAEGTSGRTPLVLSTSRDEGATWSRPRILESRLDEGYSYIAMAFTESALLLAYCAGGADVGGNLNRLRMRRMALADLGV